MAQNDMSWRKRNELIFRSKRHPAQRRASILPSKAVKDRGTTCPNRFSLIFMALSGWRRGGLSPSRIRPLRCWTLWVNEKASPC